MLAILGVAHDDDLSPMQNSVSNETVKPSNDSSLMLDASEQGNLLAHREPWRIPAEVPGLLNSHPTYFSAHKVAFDKYTPLVGAKPAEKRTEPVSEDMRRDAVAQSRRNIRSRLDDVQHADMESYAERFNEQATNAAVVLAEVGVDELNGEKEAVELAQNEKRERERKAAEKISRETLQTQEDARADLCHRAQLMKNRLVRSELESIEVGKRKGAALKRAFRSAGRTLGKYLGEARNDVVTKYSDLTMAYKSQRHNLAGDAGITTGTNEWLHSRQVVEVRLELARCVKDKLPKGRYAILCSVLDRIGGSVLDYQNHGWRKVTAPRSHNGEYYLNNMRFERSLLIVAPSRAEVTPSMVYLFELFLLKSKEYSHDQVLGWGVFPLIDSNFELNSGKFKVSCRIIDLPSRFRCCSDPQSQKSTSTAIWRRPTERTSTTGYATSTSPFDARIPWQVLPACSSSWTRTPNCVTTWLTPSSVSPLPVFTTALTPESSPAAGNQLGHDYGPTQCGCRRHKSNRVACGTEEGNRGRNSALSLRG